MTTCFKHTEYSTVETLRTTIPCCDYWQNWDMAEAKTGCCFAAPCRLATGSGEMNHLGEKKAFNVNITLN